MSVDVFLIVSASKFRQVELDTVDIRGKSPSSVSTPVIVGEFGK